MISKIVKRIPAIEVKNHFGPIVQEVATTGASIIIETQGRDQAVIISLEDFQKLWSEAEAGPTSERERVRAALRSAGLLSEPTVHEIAEVEVFESQHSPEDRERILAEWRRMKIDPRFPRSFSATGNGRMAK